jgi:MFS family permease
VSEPLSQAEADQPSLTEPEEFEEFAPTPGEGFGAVLRNRSFVAIWVAQMTSQTAQNTLWYSLIIMVGGLTGQKALGVGLTIILVQLPTVMFSSLSGVLVDRMSNQLILIGTNVIRVGGVLAYLLFQHNLVGLYVVTFVVAVISQPFAPAEGSTIPLLVRGEQLITANSLFQMTMMASQAVGFAIGPVAIGLLGIPTTLVILAGLFGVAALVLIGLPSVTRLHEERSRDSLMVEAERVGRDLKEVALFIWGDQPLAIALFQLALAPMLLLVLAEVGPDFLSNQLHLGQTSTSLFFLLAPAGAGLGVGIFILGHWGFRLRKEKLVLASLIALGVTVIGLASVQAIASMWQGFYGIGIHVPVGIQITVTIVPIAALLGIEVAFLNAPVQTIVQQRATEELRGRVLAMQQTISSGMSIPPLILVGGFASIFGTPATLSIVGLVMILAGLGLVYYS